MTGARQAVIPVFVGVILLVSLRQHIIILGFNFTPLRALLLFAWLRILTRREHLDLKLGPIDKVVLLLFAWTAIAYVLLRGGSLDAVKFYLGESYDGLGLYFMFRALVRSREDILLVLRQLAPICVGLAILLVWEGIAQTSPLTVIGGIWEVVEEREGRMRCRAAFGHPVMAGLVGATLLPLWVACWWQDGSLKKWAVRGAVAATVITLTSGSSTPLGAYMAGGFALLLWSWRDRMRLIRWGAILVLLGLNFVMQAHVWDLLSRVQILGGNSAYHRANLFEQFYQHFGDWWALGTVSTDSWGWDMWDVSNYFLLMGKRGGFLSFVLFLCLIGFCFRQVGRAVRAADGDRPTQILTWALGAALFAHCVAFLGCAYWDQFMVFWYLELAMLASLNPRVRIPEAISLPQEAPKSEQMSEAACAQ